MAEEKLCCPSCRATGGLISPTTAILTDKKVSGLAMAGHFAGGEGRNAVQCSRRLGCRSRHSRGGRISPPADFRTLVPVARLVDFLDAVEGFGTQRHRTLCFRESGIPLLPRR
jgi:hypothetical protein